MILNMCINNIKTGDELSLSLVKNTIGIDILGCCYTKSFYLTLMQELVNSCNKKGNSPEEKRIEDLKLSLLKSVMSRCCAKRMNSDVIKGLKAVKTHENSERQLLSLLKSKRIASVALQALEDNIGLFIDRPSIMERFIEGIGVPTLEYDPDITTAIIRKIANLNYLVIKKTSKKELSDGKKGDSIEKEEQVTDVNQAILKRDEQLKTLLLWLKKHYSNNRELNEPQYMVLCILRSLDGLVSPQTEALVADLLDFFFTTKKVNKNNGSSILDWCYSTNYSSIAIRCFNNIDVEYNFNIANTLNLIMFLKKIIRNDDYFTKAIDIIRKITDSGDEDSKEKRIIDHLKEKCPMLVELIMIKLKKYDENSNPLRQQVMTITERRIALQKKRGLNVAVIAS